MTTFFSKVIKAGDRLYEFNFRQLSGSDKKYYVDVPDEKGNRIIFHMYKDEKGAWKTSEKLPLWVQNAEHELSEAIEQQEAENNPPVKRKSS